MKIQLKTLEKDRLAKCKQIVDPNAPPPPVAKPNEKQEKPVAVTYWYIDWKEVRRMNIRIILGGVQ